MQHIVQIRQIFTSGKSKYLSHHRSTKFNSISVESVWNSTIKHALISCHYVAQTETYKGINHVPGGTLQEQKIKSYRATRRRVGNINLSI